MTSRLVIGLQPVRELVRVHGRSVAEVLVEGTNSPRLDGLRRFAADRRVAVREVGRVELDRLSGSSTHQGVAAFGPDLPLANWEDLELNPSLLAIALDGIVDPQNFGAIVRSAVGLADAPVIWPESASAPLTPATFRASAGAIEHATLCRVRALHGTLRSAADHGIQVVGMDPAAPQAIHEIDWRRPSVLVIGSEQKGMSRAVRKTCTALAHLTMSSTIQSLNASVAAGIALHTAVVQRAPPPPHPG